MDRAPKTLEVALVAWGAPGALPELLGRTRDREAVEVARDRILAAQAGDFDRLTRIGSDGCGGNDGSAH